EKLLHQGPASISPDERWRGRSSRPDASCPPAAIAGFETLIRPIRGLRERLTRWPADDEEQLIIRHLCDFPELRPGQLRNVGLQDVTAMDVLIQSQGLAGDGIVVHRETHI